jgi:integrase
MHGSRIPLPNSSAELTPFGLRSLTPSPLNIRRQEFDPRLGQTPRQFNRLVKLWIADAGFDPANYGVDSLRRTKALHILKGTGDLQVVRALLGHANDSGYVAISRPADEV